MGLPAAQVLAGTDLTAPNVLLLPVSYPMTNASFGNSTAETVVGTFTLPALTSIGQGFQFKIACSAGGTSSPTLTMRMRVVTAGGTIIGSGAGTVTSATAWFMFDGWMKFTAVGSGGTFASLVNIQENLAGSAGAGTANGPYSTNATAWNTTTTQQVFVTAQFNAANAANVAGGLTGDAYQL